MNLDKLKLELELRRKQLEHLDFEVSLLEEEVTGYAVILDLSDEELTTIGSIKPEQVADVRANGEKATTARRMQIEGLKLTRQIRELEIERLEEQLNA